VLDDPEFQPEQWEALAFTDLAPMLSGTWPGRADNATQLTSWPAPILNALWTKSVAELQAAFGNTSP
jgi:hypothetical protein